MAEQTNSGGGNTGLAFIVGAVVVVLGVIAWVMFSGGMTQTKKVDVDVDLPKVEAPSVPTPAPPGG